MSPSTLARVGRKFRRWLAQAILERINGGEALRQDERSCRPLGVRRSHAVLRGCLHLSHGGEIHLDADPEAGTGERTECELPIFDAQPDPTGRALVEIGVRPRECRLLTFGGRGHAVDEMVAIAFDVGQASSETSARSCCTLHSSLRREVFARHEVIFRADLAIQLGDARGVQHRFIQALAALARDTAVAERQRRRER